MRQDDWSGTRTRWHPKRILFACALVLAYAAGHFRSGEAPGTGAPVDTPATRDAAALERELLLLEAKMHQGLSWTEHQSALARRAEGITAIACAGAVSHAEEAERLARRTFQRVESQSARVRARPSPPPDSPAAPTLAVPVADAAQTQHSG